MISAIEEAADLIKSNRRFSVRIAIHGEASSPALLTSKLRPWAWLKSAPLRSNNESIIRGILKPRSRAKGWKRKGKNEWKKYTVELSRRQKWQWNWEEVPREHFQTIFYERSVWLWFNLIIRRKYGLWVTRWRNEIGVSKIYLKFTNQSELRAKLWARVQLEGPIAFAAPLLVILPNEAVSASVFASFFAGTCDFHLREDHEMLLRMAWVAASSVQARGFLINVPRVTPFVIVALCKYTRWYLTNRSSLLPCNHDHA